MDPLIALTLAACAGWLAPARADYNPNARVFIEQKIAANSATVAFTGGITGAYKAYVVELIGVKPVNDAVYLRLRMSSDGGGSWITGSDYQTGGWVTCSSGGYGEVGIGGVAPGASDTFILLTDGDFGNGNGTPYEDTTGTVTIFDPLSAARRTRVKVQTVVRDHTDDDCLHDGFGHVITAAAHDGFQFSYSGGNISTGTFRLYGVR